MDREQIWAQIRSLGTGMIVGGAVLAVGAFIAGWYLPRPVLSAVAGLLGVGAGPLLVGLTMRRVTELPRLVFWVNVWTTVSGLVWVSALITAFFAERTLPMLMSLLGYALFALVSSTVCWGVCRVVEQGNKKVGSGVQGA